MGLRSGWVTGGEARLGCYTDASNWARTAPWSLSTFRRHERGKFIMKIVVIGGTGLIGSKLAAKLVAHGHDAVPASPGTGVNTLTGQGLAEALAGADVVVDVSNSPSFEDTAVLKFFETSTSNILGAEAAAGVG